MQGYFTNGTIQFNNLETTHLNLDVSTFQNKYRLPLKSKNSGSYLNIKSWYQYTTLIK